MIWSSLPPMPTSRREFQAGLVTFPNGDKGILAVGGENVKSVEFLNLDTLIWEPKQGLPYDIYWGSSVQFQDSLLVVGGNSFEMEKHLDTVYYYDPKSDRWDLVGMMDFERRSFAAFLVPDSFANCH